MLLRLQLAALTLASVAGWAADQKNAAKNPPPPRAVAPRPKNPAKNAGGGRNMGPRITNPANPVSHLYRASPEERERALERIPAAQQERMRKNLDWFDHLPKDQQQIVMGQAQRFEALPPQGKQAFQQALRSLQSLPQDRHQAVGGALRRLQIMPPEQRATVLESDQFKSRFSPEELKILSDLSTVMLPPM